MAYDYNLSYDENRQDWRIDLWMAKHGVTASDFDEHPQIDDVIKMINIRDYLWHRMNKSEQASWGAYWNVVFYKKRRLNNKFWNKMDLIAQNIDAREQLHAYARQKLNYEKQRLQSRLKQNPKNKDHNEEAKGSNLSKVIGVEMEPQGGREVLDTPPWE
jgi:hypothetical protein